MANLQDLGDEEFMAAWDAAGEKLQAAKDEVKAYSAEHQRRLAVAEEERVQARRDAIESGAYDTSLDQAVGRVAG